MSRLRDPLLFCLLALLWGSTYVAIEVGLRTLPPVWFVALRFDVATLALGGYILASGSDRLPEEGADWLAVAVSALFIIGANNTLLFVGQQYTTSGIAAVVYSLVPIVTTAFVALLLGGGGLDGRGYLGVLLGLVGVSLVAQPDPSNLTGGVTRGVALISCAVVAVSLGSVLLRRLETTTPSLTLTAWAMGGGAVGVHALSAGLGEAPINPAVDPAALLAVVFLGIFPSALAYTIYFALLARLGPFQINLVSYVVPVVATVAGWALLGEPVSALTIAGFATIVLGFALVKRRTIAAELPRVRARLFG